MVGPRLRFLAPLLSGPLFIGCMSEETLTADDVTVLVPTGAGQTSSANEVATTWSSDEPVNTTPYGPFDASGIDPAFFYEEIANGGGGGGGGSGGGGGDDSSTSSAMLRVSGTIMYSGNVSGMDHQILEGDYPEIHSNAAGTMTVGVDESRLPVGLSVPGFAGLSAFAIDVTPVGEPVEYTGTSTGLGMDYTYEVTPRAWSANSAGFHGEFDMRMTAVAGNGFTISGNLTHTVDGSWAGASLTYSATTAYHCELVLASHSLLFVAHQTFEFSGMLRREDE